MQVFFRRAVSRDGIPIVVGNLRHGPPEEIAALTMAPGIVLISTLN